MVLFFQCLEWLFILVQSALNKTTKEECVAVFMSEPRLVELLCEPNPSSTPRTPSTPKLTTQRHTTPTVNVSPQGEVNFDEYLSFLVQRKKRSLNKKEKRVLPYKPVDDDDNMKDDEKMRDDVTKNVDLTKDDNVGKGTDDVAKDDDITKGDDVAKDDAKDNEFQYTTIVPPTVATVATPSSTVSTITTFMDDGQFDEAIIIDPNHEDLRSEETLGEQQIDKQVPAYVNLPNQAEPDTNLPNQADADVNSPSPPDADANSIIPPDADANLPTPPDTDVNLPIPPDADVNLPNSANQGEADTTGPANQGKADVNLDDKKDGHVNKENGDKLKMKELMKEDLIDQLDDDMPKDKPKIGREIKYEEDDERPPSTINT